MTDDRTYEQRVEAARMTSYKLRHLRGTAYLMGEILDAAGLPEALERAEVAEDNNRVLAEDWKVAVTYRERAEKAERERDEMLRQKAEAAPEVAVLWRRVAKAERERDGALEDKALFLARLKQVHAEADDLVREWKGCIAAAERERDEALAALKETDSWAWNKVVHGRYGPVNEDDD